MKTNGHTAPWPPEYGALLRQWWAEGLAASVIAARLGGGLTRNAVIGKVNRMARKGLIDRKDRPKFLPDGKRVGQGGTGFVAPQFAKHMPKSISTPAPAVVVPEHASAKRGPKSKPRQEAQKPPTVARMISRRVPAPEKAVGPPRAPALTHPAALSPGQPLKDTESCKPDPSKPTVFTIKSGQCRWPEGDPQQPDFHFCGSAIDESLQQLRPYCSYHWAMAIGPGTESERRAVALKRSTA